MINKHVNYLRENLVINYKCKDNDLYVNIISKINDLQLYFACYLLINDSVVEKTNYRKDGQFYFKLDKTAHVKLKVFIRDLTNEVRTSKLYDLNIITVSSRNQIFNEKRYLNKINEKNGELLFEKNEIYFPSFDVFKLNIEEIFDIDPFLNRSWLWRVQQLTHLIYLINYSYVKPENVISIIKEQINIWFQYSLSEKGKQNSMLWHDHGTALRLQNIIFIFNNLTSRGFLTQTEDSFFLFLELIELHISKLKSEEFYSKHTNHGFDQALILFESALEFEYVFKMHDVIKLAEDRILDEINFAFCADGGHKENSPSYLNFGIKQCLMALNIFKNYNVNSSSLLKINEIINKATLALAYFTKPNGLLPLIGDTSEYKVADFFQGDKPENYKYFKYSISKGSVGVKPLSRGLILPETGYAIYRNNWDKNEFNNSIYLTFKASFHSNYHRHDDDLSFTLYGYGEDWLIDGGIFKYDEKNLHRKYIRSHFSHNILSPDDGLALRSKENRHETYLENIQEEPFTKFNVTGYSSMFKNYKSKRNICINDFDGITITDTCKNLENDIFSITSRLFICENKLVEIDRNIIRIKGNSKSLIIEIDFDFDFEIKLIKKEKKNIVGWLSKNNNQLYQSNYIEIKCKNFYNNAILKMYLKFQ